MNPYQICCPEKKKTSRGSHALPLLISVDHDGQHEDIHWTYKLQPPGLTML